MKTTELRNMIADSTLFDWYNSVNVHIEYPHIDFDQTITGLSSIHKFFDQQINGWDKFGEDIPTHLIESKSQFVSFKKRIENLLITINKSNYTEGQINNLWIPEKNK
jgi:hypothetical protein